MARDPYNGFKTSEISVSDIEVYNMTETIDVKLVKQRKVNLLFSKKAHTQDKCV